MVLRLRCPTTASTFFSDSAGSGINAPGAITASARPSGLAFIFTTARFGTLDRLSAEAFFVVTATYAS
jgi:hypothetical protein